MIISVDELKTKLWEEELILVDCFYNEHEYRRGHIPSAIRRIGHPYVKSGDFLNPGLYYPKSNQFEKIASEMGIGSNSLVVAYDGDGSLFATRFLWGLMYYGHKNVKLLNGGWQAWINAGYPISVEKHKPRQTKNKFLSKINKNLVISNEEILQVLESPKTKIIDVRSDDEYLGQDNKGNLRAGRIPNSIHIEWTDLLLNQNTTEKLSTIKAKKKLVEIFKNNNLGKEDQIITYCQGGVRASLVAYVLLDFGFAHVRVYDGSMMEWANDQSTPLE